MSNLTDTSTRIARVIIDTPVPHLDRLFDYEIKDKDVQVGSLVRVKLAGRRVNAFVLEIANESSFEGKLASIERVVSSVPLIDETMIRLAKDLAKRNAAPISKIIFAMVPSRHASAEQSFLSTNSLQVRPPSEFTKETSFEHWREYRGAVAFLSRICKGESPKAVWLTLSKVFPPRMEHHPLLDLVAATLQSKRRVLIVVPTAKDVDLFEQIFKDSSYRVCCQRALDSAYKRYKTYLEIRFGLADVVIGTRSAIYAPVPELGLISVWDDGDDRLTDQQSPYLSALEIAVRRSHLEGTALVSAGASVSVEQAQLIRSGWAPVISADQKVVRSNTALIEVPDEYDISKEGPAGRSRIPPSVQSFIRQSLESGPVLVHVPAGGWVSVVACTQCQQTARCNTCHGPIRASKQGTLTCMWCSRVQVNWRCTNCGSSTWKATRVGSERTAEEFGRAFSKVLIETSTAEHPVTHFSKSSGIVIATPGMEPVPTSGYSAAVVLDAWAILGRPELWAPSEAIRRWMNVHSLVKADGKMVVVGVRDPFSKNALVRRDPLGYAMHLLDEREQLGFFPAMCMVAVDGDRKAVTSFIEQLHLPNRVELVGVAPRVGRDIPKSHADEPTRAIYRCPWDIAFSFIEQIRSAVVARSVRKQPPITVNVNPSQLL